MVAFSFILRVLILGGKINTNIYSYSCDKSVARCSNGMDIETGRCRVDKFRYTQGKLTNRVPDAEDDTNVFATDFRKQCLISA